MKITIQIEDATPAIISALANFSAVKVTKSSVPEKKVRSHKWSRKAKMNLKVRTPDAPYGLKKDGTPRAKPGARKLGAAQ